jgi:TRAP-type C4-dicarboxylate transport system permease small subunit
MGQMTSSLGVPVGVFYIMLPVCGVLNLIYTVLNIIDIAKGNISLTVADEATEALEKVEKEGR